jgi:hypothetical protein
MFIIPACPEVYIGTKRITCKPIKAGESPTVQVARSITRKIMF